MTAKELNKAIETFFTNQKPKECLTYESLMELFDKQPTSAQAGTIHKLIQKHKACIYTSSEHAKLLNDKEAEARRSAQRKMIENNETDNFDILKEYKNIMIEGGGNMFELSKNMADYHLCFLSPQIGGKTGFGGMNEKFEILNILQDEQDIIMWMKRDK